MDRVPAKCRRHAWCHHDFASFDRSICAADGWMHMYCDLCGRPLDGACGEEPDRCTRCDTPKDLAASRRGRTALRAGKDAERAIAKAYGGTRTGMYGGPDDVVTGMFVVQSKAGGWFSERVWTELQKLPRTGGRIPTLIISDRPGAGHPTRRYVIREMRDDLDLYGPDATKYARAIESIHTAQCAIWVGADCDCGETK